MSKLAYRPPPPHGRNPVIFDGPCDCESCNQYHQWVDVAEEMDELDGEHCPTCGQEWTWHGRDEAQRVCDECRYGT